MSGLSADQMDLVVKTSRAIHPMQSRLLDVGLTPARLNMPWLGLYPTIPQNEAGRMIDPAVWVPVAAST
nr:hypothetical protein [Paraburkholderia gardini]